MRAEGQVKVCVDCGGVMDKRVQVGSALLWERRSSNRKRCETCRGQQPGLKVGQVKRCSQCNIEIDVAVWRGGCVQWEHGSRTRNTCGNASCLASRRELNRERVRLWRRKKSLNENQKER